VVDCPIPATVLDPSQALLVGVGGRPGSGRRTVTRALRGAGLAVAGPGESADVEVYVFVETVNADDRAALASALRPTVAVLNKADLAGFRGDGPIEVATRRCRELERATAVPTRPLSALLAVAGTDPTVLDRALVDALRILATAPEAVPDAARRRLGAELDLFGTACAVSAVRSGARRDDLAALLRTVSGLAELSAEIERTAAPVRYRRLTAGLAAMAARDSRVLTGDDVVLARMAAAAAVVGAAGVPDRSEATRSDQLRRAIHWQRYAVGPVSALHRACATDIARGALRLWARADDAPAARR
jgi:hypothetical protein